MRIISNDRFEDISYENKDLYIFENGDNDWQIRVRNGGFLGFYTTLEKASKVMEMIRNKYLESHLASIDVGKNAGCEFPLLEVKTNIYFYMPQDDELD